jgi:hypothetical protein
VATPISNPAPSELTFSNTAYIEPGRIFDPDLGNNSASVVTRIAELPADAGPEEVESRALGLSSANDGAGNVVRFSFNLPEPEEHVELAVFDLRGRRVTVVARGALPAGRHVADWQYASGSRRTPRGLYVARLSTRAGSALCKVWVGR